MKLYIAHVGFSDHELGIHELHSNIFVVAADVNSAKEAVKNKEIYIRKKMHIDGIEELCQIDGYKIILEKSDKPISKKISDDDDIISLEYSE